MTPSLYELHVRGYTKKHPAVPEYLRGTYCGLAHPAVLDYIKSLGVTSIELLPIHAFINDSHLLDQGLTNYWGYNSIGYFSPDPRYAYDRAQTLEGIEGDGGACSPGRAGGDSGCGV